jgi:preprotein translocase subunit SecB
MHGQYIKDLSFENPRAPQSLIEQTQPQLSLNVQVTNRQFDAKTFEVPRLLFPFARAVVANATREAGFPPLNIAPVDFVALYRQQLEANGGKMPGITPGGPVGHA